MRLILSTCALIRVSILAPHIGIPPTLTLKCTDVAVLMHEGVVRGHHIYKETWTPSVGEILCVQQELENAHDH